MYKCLLGGERLITAREHIPKRRRCQERTAHTSLHSLATRLHCTQCTHATTFYCYVVGAALQTGETARQRAREMCMHMPNIVTHDMEKF